MNLKENIEKFTRNIKVVAEPIVPLEAQMTTHGRSISSTIMDFFRTPLDGRHYEGKEGDDKELLGLQCGTEIDIVDHGSGIGDGSENAIPAELGTMIFLRDEEQEKPPIVSVLPVERLKLLRQKQEWRRRTESMMLKLSHEVQVPDAILSSQYVAELPDTSDSRFSFKQSDTPSPLKQDARNKHEDAQHLTLRISKYKKISEKERRGTKWSGDLEYDLAEYDNFPKQDTTKVVGSKASNVGVGKSTKIKNSGLPTLLHEGTRGRGLSDTQRNILLKGPDSLLGKKTEASTRVNSAKQGESTTFAPSLSDNLSNVDENKVKSNVILPSFGFDFVKDKENSLGGVSAPRTEISTTIPPPMTEAPSTIKSMSGVSKIHVPAAPAKREADRTDKLPMPNLAKTIYSGNDDEGDEPRRKRKVPAGTTNEQKGGVFSFEHSQEVGSSKASFPVQKPQGNVGQKSFGFFDSTNDIKQKRPLEVEENLKVSTPDLGNSTVEKSKPKLDFSFQNTEHDSAAKIASLPDGNGTSNEKPAEKQSFTFFNKSTESGSTNTEAFSFGKPKVDSIAKPSFSFGSVTEAGKPDNKSSKPSFGFEPTDNGKSSPKPALTFGVGKDSTSVIKPGFTFGSKDAANSNVPKPSFTFGSKDGNGTTSKPSFEFGTKATPPISLESSKSGAATPTLTFGAAANKGSTAKSSFFPSGQETTEGTASKSGLILSKPDETSGNVEPQSSSNAATPSGPERLDNSSAVNEPKTLFNFSSTTQTNSNSEKPKSGGFTFSRKADGSGSSMQNSAAMPGVNFQTENKSKPNFSFGVGKTALNGGLKGQNEIQPSAPAPAPAPSAFSFNRAALPTNKSTPGGFASSAALPTGTTTTGGQSSFNFKMNPDITKGPALNPTNSSVNPSANPFIGGISNAGGFAFGQPSGNPVPNSNGPTLFGSAQAIKPIGNSSTPSPAFGQSATPPAIVSNTSSRAFTPSNTINLNFGNSATVNPSTIFSGAPQQPAGIMGNGTPPPQQVFGVTPPPSSHPFGSNLQQPNLGFNSTQLGFANNQNENVQAPSTNFQLPQGRKLARMRQSRRG